MRSASTNASRTEIRFHRLKHNKSSRRPRRVILFCVSSDTVQLPDHQIAFEPKAYAAVALDLRRDTSAPVARWYAGRKVTELWDLVESYARPGMSLYLASPRLEAHFLPAAGLSELVARGWDVDSFFVHQKALKIEFASPRGRIVAFGLAGLFQRPLEEWIPILGMQPTPLPAQGASASEHEQYAMFAAEASARLFLAWLEFLDSHNLGNFRLTLASQAKTAFQHRFMSHDIIIHELEDVIDLERAGYHGGRVQALKTGEFTDGPYYELDVSSMYGAIMRDALLPRRLKEYYPDATIPLLDWAVRRHGAVAEVEIEAREPVCSRALGDRTEYPVGRFVTVLTTPELRYALERGWVRRAYRLAVYEVAPIFREYAEYFLALKERYTREQNLPMRAIAKLFLNALYGKFGQRGYASEEIGQCGRTEMWAEVSYDIVLKERVTYVALGGRVFRIKPTRKAWEAFVAIPAHITAEGRLRLWELMRQAGLEHVYHVATDALIVDSEGRRRLDGRIGGETAGSLRVRTVGDTLTIYAPCDYVLGAKIAIKGVQHADSPIDERTYANLEYPTLISTLSRPYQERYLARLRILHLRKLKEMNR